MLDDLDRHSGARGTASSTSHAAEQPEVVVKQLGDAGSRAAARSDGKHAPGDERPPGWTRVVIEKPFGRDLETARELDRVIGQVFDERQVYRIDHYLAKETVQNLLVLRFANVIFEPVWNRRYVDFVEITAAETLGVEHRGPYYEEAGALRDMITPHLIQLFSLVAMEPPAAFDADGVRDEKMKVLRAVRPIPPQSVGDWAVRGAVRAGPGGRRGRPGLPRRGAGRAGLLHGDVRGAQAASIDNWRWQGVPFYLRTGKRMAQARHRDRHPLQAAARAALQGRGRGRRPAAERPRAARAAGRGLLAQHRVQAAGPRGRPAARGHGLLLRRAPCTNFPSAPTRRCSSTPWRAT